VEQWSSSADTASSVLADSGFFSVANIEELARRGIDGMLPDSNHGAGVNQGQRAVGIGRNRIRSPQLRCYAAEIALSRRTELYTGA